MKRQTRRGALLVCLFLFFLPLVTLSLTSCIIGAPHMANNTQRLTASGVLGSIQAGGSRTVTPGLTDGQSSLDINQVIVSNGLTFTINNVVDPSTVTFFNPTQAAIDGAFYKITHDHSIQTQYPTPAATTVGADTAPTADNATGALEAWNSVAQAATPAGTPALVTLPNSQNYGSASAGVSLAANLLTLAATTVARNWLVTASVSVSSAAAELVTLQLTQDPAGAATVLSQSRATTGAGGSVNLTVQAVIATGVAPTVVGLFINSPAGVLSVNLNLTKGAHVTVQSL
jgi:hypothetical protein